ncbi:polysaccharide biosynthesis/export family protein [uncultured Winogradskyella sp.]|uniref:polysaccharide biosynthesis/export family protein n=1 Tax=uncultured Winogradskyella sp. TaxID=395353 RepID=UPI00260D3CB5|nr:polysaccharide biosynthesis/export family protein [uncultured Winogradskyella sp.]
MNFKILGFFCLFFLASCASKKEVLYLQDIEVNKASSIPYQSATIQPNDILKVTIGSLEPEAALPYNKGISLGAQPQNLELMKLDGYVVSLSHTITIPVLGEIITQDKTTKQLEEIITSKLISEGHLTEARVNVRLINAKVTILGEVNNPGTFNYTDQNMTLIQALGYAGDLTINGKRDDILMTREVDGIRKITRIDLTSAEFMNSEFYFVRPNDFIIVNQNNPRVKNAGFVKDVGTILTIASLALSITILLSR